MAEKNAVHHVLDQIPGGDCSTFKGGTTPNGLIAQMQKNTVNAALICNVAETLSLQNVPAANEPVMPSGPSFVGTALGIAASTITGPVGAVVGAVMAANDIKNFSTQHAAIDGAQGELTIAAADRSHNAPHDNMGETYTNIFGETHDVMTGQSIRPQQPVPAGRASPLDIAAARTREAYTPEEIARDVRHQLEKNQKGYALAANKLDMLTEGETRTRDQKLGWDPDVLAELNPDKPRPKALDVGMRGTGLSFSAPVAPAFG